MTAVEKLLSVALAEVGYLEKRSNAQLDDKTANAGRGNWTKYARDLDRTELFNGPKNGYEWCCTFAIWPFVQVFSLGTAMGMLNIPKKSSAAGVKYLAGYLKSAGRFHTRGPQPGDLIFFWKKDLKSWAHVGLVERSDGQRVYTVEGNTSGASGVVANGGGVARKSYALTYNRIAGYGRPDWSLVAVEEEEDEDMDVKKFRQLYLEMRKEDQDNDAGSWSQEARDWAVANGIVNGSGDGPDGQPNYMWEDGMTREQFVTVLWRVAKWLKAELR